MISRSSKVQAFLNGMGSILQLWPSNSRFHRKSRKLFPAEFLASDWKKVRGDFSQVLGDLQRAKQKVSDKQK